MPDGSFHTSVLSPVGLAIDHSFEIKFVIPLVQRWIKRHLISTLN